MRLPEGDYVFEMIAHDEQGKSYSKEDPLNSSVFIIFNYI